MITVNEKYEKYQCGIAGSTQPGQAKEVATQMSDKIQSVLLTHLNGHETTDVVNYEESDGSFTIRVNVVEFRAGGVSLTIGVADDIADELQAWLVGGAVEVDALLRVVISHTFDESASTKIIVQ